jgi:hypothetical protein
MSSSYSERLAERRAHTFAAAAHLAAAEAMTEAEAAQADGVTPDEVARSTRAAHQTAARAHEAAAQAAVLVQLGADGSVSASATLAAIAASRAADPELDLVSAGYLPDGTSPLGVAPSDRAGVHSKAAKEHDAVAGCS